MIMGDKVIWIDKTMGYAEHQDNYLSQVKNFEFYDEVRLPDNKRKKWIHQHEKL